MDRNTYTRIQDTVARAIEAPQDDWPEIVDQSCGDDAEMRAKVLELLRLVSDEGGAFSEVDLRGTARLSGEGVD